jgi:hypothetical protein
VSVIRMNHLSHCHNFDAEQKEKYSKICHGFENLGYQVSGEISVASRPY